MTGGGGGATTTAAQSASTTSTTQLGGASTASVSVPPSNPPTSLLRDVRVTREDAFDRVTFEFTNSVPGYAVAYVERPITEDGSGREVTLRGADVLKVRMENALDADLSKEDAPRTYTGPNRISPATGTIAELVRTGAFEGVLSWVIGVETKARFKVETLQSPPRLVIDIAHH